MSESHIRHPPSNIPFVSRGGLKLACALDAFGLDVHGLRCADFGCNVGGFTDCLLQRGATGVVAIDTGYGALAWKLRQDSRVRVMERTNALHAALPERTELVDMVVIDLGWTPQRLCIPAALKWLRPETGRIVSLIKPHYEVHANEKDLLTDGVLAESDAERIKDRVLAEMPPLGASVIGCVRSPVVGGAGKKNTSGNIEWLSLLERARSES